jgi:hypothetical protein
MKRYTVMSVPGRREDGEDTSWFVYDRQDRRSVCEAEDFEVARELAKVANMGESK